MLFDLDNTLFDFDGASKLAFKLLIEQHGYAFTEELYKTYKTVNQQTWQELEQGLIDQTTLRGLRFQRFFEQSSVRGNPEEFNANYLENITKFPLLWAGAESLLERLSGKIKMAIVTNGLKEVQRPRIEAAKLSHHFEAIIVSDEIGVAKPEKEFFEITLSETGIKDKKEAIIIGDNLLSDILGGINYGIDTVWFNPKNKENPTKLSPTFEAKNLREVGDFLLGEKSL